MDDSVKKKIINDFQIKKFSAYGFLKNLDFFKPYLIIFLMSQGLNLFQIGLLYSIRELVIYLFEFPSGIIADYFGRKKELCICFIFYIISFIIFFFVQSFSMAIMAMIFYGLGEAFRSGTHKAMILKYLDIHNLREYKTFVYGRTRSFSLMGSAINSLIAICIILFWASYKYIFIFSVIPYILDFMLILTYPNYLDKDDKHDDKSSKSVKSSLVDSLKNKQLRTIVLDQSIFQSVVKSTKDMIQPVLSTIILSSGVLIIDGVSQDNLAKISLGGAYFLINIISSISSKNVYKLQKNNSTEELMKIFYIGLVVDLMFISIGISINIALVSVICFFILNILGDARKPLYIDVLDVHMDKKLRATTISVESQITAIFTMIISPLFGYIADKFTIGTATMVIAGFMLILKFAINQKK